MSSTPTYRELECPSCGWSQLCGPGEMLQWLRRAGKARPGKGIEPDVLLEVFLATAGQMDCPECGARGLLVSAAADDAAEWPDARMCEACRQPIPAERLQAVPSARLCTACQQAEDEGRGPAEIEYCPRCGSPMRLELSSGRGVARYMMRCTNRSACRG
ncbi:MAG: TraR/DksA family transcriptional regulator [Planctomycetota bacterium]